jgi:hypothetical protein
MHILSMFAGLVMSTSAFAGPFDWNVRAQWSPAMEKKFSEFVQIMGDSGCKSLTACLTSPAANPFYASRTPRSDYPADCADFPYAVRMYFAWMEGLPFDYVNRPVQANPGQETSGDIRYSKFGNKPGGFRAISAGQTFDFKRELINMRNSVSTATYRMHYDFVSDFYPMKVDRNSIMPGTAVYDPSGHAAIIYKVERDGRIKMMDAHPDNSVTRITYDQRFVRSRPGHGAGFRNWRPELSTAPTAQIPGYSLEQFERAFAIGNESVTYYDYVRAKLAGSLKFNPVVEVKAMVSEICSNIKDRVASVNLAIKDNIQLKGHPDKLPSNIYGTSGEWEEYSTPSRDARLKTSFVEMRKEAERFLQMYSEGSSRIEYSPVQNRYNAACAGNKVCTLAGSMMQAYEEAATAAECGFQYTKSNGQVVKFGVTEMVKRLYLMSFDPYHCVELRWGASAPDELASCGDDRYKRQWYAAEQGLRNQIERKYDERMDFDVNGTTRLGVPQAPPADLWALLNSKVAPRSAAR